MFDPYDQWLGIPPTKRPVTYYQLLGIDADETDLEVITTAARKRLARLKAHADGPHAQVQARLVKELEQAKSTLLQPGKRKAYDRLLQDLAAKKKGPEPEEDEEGILLLGEDDEDDAEEPRRGNGRPAPRRRPERASRKKEPKSRSALPLVLGGVIGLIAFVASGVTVAWLLSPKKEDPAPVVPVAVARPALEAAPPAEPKKESPPVVTPVAKAPLPAPAPPPKAAKPKVNKLPVPDDAAQGRASDTIHITYAADYAKPRPEDKLALAAKFLQPGREDRSDPGLWFVLLREARDLSIQAGRPRLAVEAVDEIDKWFIIDPLAMKLQALNQIAQSPSEPVVRAVARIALAQVNPALDAEQFDAALKFIDLASTAATVKKDAAKPDDKQPEKPDDKSLTKADDKAPPRPEKPEELLVAKVEAKRKEVLGYQKEANDALAAQARLKEKPDDAEANLCVGKWLCFGQGKWDEGLPMLARCPSKELIKDTATKDLAQPADPKEQLKVAEGWRYFASKLEPREEMIVMKRAVEWYVKAEAKAPPLEKAKASERVQQAREKALEHLPRLLPGGFYGRNLEGRTLLLREGGGTMKSEEAVERGLDWLAAHQAANGGWSTDSFEVHAKCTCGDKGEKHDLGASSVALMAFLGAGEIYQGAKHARTVERGLEFLLKQLKNGKFSDNMYENAMATIVVCEAYGLTRNPIIKRAAVVAVNFIIGAQNSDGSWGYVPREQKGDLSVTGWQFSALKAAYYAQIDVPLDVFKRVTTFLDKVADPSDLGYGYNTPGTKPTTSGTGLLCREYLGWGPGNPKLAKGVAQLMVPENVPTKDRPSIYFCYYTTQVMHHLGGSDWEEWNRRCRDVLIDAQDQGTDAIRSHQKGSWAPTGEEFAKQGGRLLFTALATLTLETYYYHVPLYGFGSAVMLD